MDIWGVGRRRSGKFLVREVRGVFSGYDGVVGEGSEGCEGCEGCGLPRLAKQGGWWWKPLVVLGRRGACTPHAGTFFFTPVGCGEIAPSQARKNPLRCNGFAALTRANAGRHLRIAPRGQRRQTLARTAPRRHHASAAAAADLTRKATQESRVAISGHGGDLLSMTLCHAT